MSHLAVARPVSSSLSAAPPGATDPGSPGRVGEANRDLDRLSLCHREARSPAADAELARLALMSDDASAGDPQRELDRLSLSPSNRPARAGECSLDGRWM